MTVLLCHDMPMRWLVAGTIAAAGIAAWTRPANAEVMADPPIMRNCAHAKTWALVEACLKRFDARLKPLRTVRGARLILLQGGTSYAAHRWLYVTHGGEWRLAAMIDDHDDAETDPIDLAPIRIDGADGVRLTIGESARWTVRLHDMTPRPALMRTRRSLYCDGSTPRCSAIMNDCEILVQGAAIFAFHGAVSFDDGLIRVAGDRTLAGTACFQPEVTPLGWSKH